MAKMIGICKEMPYYAYPDRPDDYDKYMKDQDAAMVKLEAESDRVMSSDSGSVVGFIMSFQVADGYANYRVVKATPLQLELIPYSDAYQISAAHIRGLNMDDVRDQMGRKEAMNKIFGKKTA